MRPLRNRATCALAWLVVASAHGAVHGEPRSEPPHRELCRRDAVHRGAAIDLDVKGADIHEVFRLIADIAHLNIVVPDTVTGSVTLRLKRAPWDAVVCAIAGVHHLAIAVHDNILVVTRTASPPR